MNSTYKLLADNKNIKQYNTDNHTFFFNKNTGFSSRFNFFKNTKGELIAPQEPFPVDFNHEKSKSLLDMMNMTKYSILQDDFASSNGPELLDIMITEECNRKCAYCYQSAGEHHNFMKLDEYIEVLDAAKGTVAQVALGGGETTSHENFIDILRITREDFGIVPNYTTNGDWLNVEDTRKYELLEATRRYCGAVAVSAHGSRSEWEPKAVEMAKFGIKTNVHFILGADTIDEATDMILNKTLDPLINAVVFLLYKPVGRATSSGVLKDQVKIKTFLEAIEKTTMKVGFDACSAPIIASMSNINLNTFDFCEGGRYSGYVHWNGEVKACSFDKSTGVNIKDKSFTDIWREDLQSFRDSLSGCKCDCPYKKDCYGGCPFAEEIVVCNQEGRQVR